MRGFWRRTLGFLAGKSGDDLPGLKWSDAVPHLLPRLDEYREGHGCGERWGDLLITWVLEFPTGPVAVTEQHVNSWGWPPEELTETALDNLRRLCGDPRPRRAVGLAPGPFNVWHIPGPMGYLDSMVLLPEVVESLPLSREEMFVASPARNRLFFAAKPASPSERQALFQVARDLHAESDQPVSAYLHVWSEGRLVRALQPAAKSRRRAR